MYVVKVGEYYVRHFNMDEIILSMEMMRGYPKDRAEAIARILKAELVEISEEVTCE